MIGKAFSCRCPQILADTQPTSPAATPAQRANFLFSASRKSSKARLWTNPSHMSFPSQSPWPGYGACWLGRSGGWNPCLRMGLGESPEKNRCCYQTRGTCIWAHRELTSAQVPEGPHWEPGGQEVRETCSPSPAPDGSDRFPVCLFSVQGLLLRLCLRNRWVCETGYSATWVRTLLRWSKEAGPERRLWAWGPWTHFLRLAVEERAAGRPKAWLLHSWLGTYWASPVCKPWGCGRNQAKTRPWARAF